MGGPMDGHSIREATFGDLGSLASLVALCVEGGWGRSALESAHRDPSSRIRLAIDEGLGPVGFLVARRVGDLLEIDLVGVAPERRRAGIALKLLEDLVGSERASGAREARLELRASNQAAGSLYAGFGFVVVGRRARYYPDGEDALLLTRVLIESESPKLHTPGEGGLAASQTSPSAQVPIRVHARVLENQVDGNGKKLLLEVPGWPGAWPGQFLMLGPGAEAGVPRRDPLLPRPMAVYRDLDATSGASGGAPRIEVLYRVVGRGTTLISEAEPGQTISLVGPLGRGFPVESGPGPALLIGGGTGIASLYELARALLTAGREVTVMLGARSAADLIGRADFEALGSNALFKMLCTTEDGSLGHEGRVTEPLADGLVKAPSGTTVFACGPTPMMRAAADLAQAQGVRCFVSLENPMACGFGVCLGCAAPRREGGFSLVCRQGPVFDSLEIDWEGLP